MPDETIVKIVFPTKDLAQSFMDWFNNIGEPSFYSVQAEPNANLEYPNMSDYNVVWHVEGSDQAFGAMHTGSGSSLYNADPESLKLISIAKLDTSKLIQDIGHGFFEDYR